MKHIFARIAMISLLVASLATAATYKFELSDKVQVGQTQLEPGKYSLDVDGSTAVLKDKAGKTIEAKTKVEQLQGKVVRTAYGVTGEGGVKKLSSVVLRGTTIKVVFE